MNYILRDWKDTDIESLTNSANNKKIADNLRNVFPYPYTRGCSKFFINYCASLDKTKNLIFAIDVQGNAVGNISIEVKDDVNCKSAELGYWLSEEYWNNGIMTNAVKEICKLAFEKFDIVRIYAEVYAPNTASIRVLERAGFIFEGTMRNSCFKNGEILDSHMYALLRSF